MPVFSRLELNNFKSYKNETCIEWQQFSSVIGPNGVGKSTVADAIEFVFCLSRYAKISINHFREDVCNKNVNDDRSTWVKVIFNFNGTEKSFQRSANYTDLTYEYLINNAVVSAKEYRNSLFDIDINYRANNFLIQQNSIESIAMKGPKDRCELFERISNSISYKKDYTSLNKELKQCTLETEELKKTLTDNLKQKKILMKSVKDMKQSEKLSEELKQVEIEYHLAKFYQIDSSIYDSLKQKEESIIKIKCINKLRNANEKTIAELKCQLKEFEANLSDFHKDTEETQKKFFKYSTKMIKLEQNLESCKSSISRVETNLNTAKKLDEARSLHIQNLECDYNKIKKEREAFLNSQSQTCSLQLEDDQYEEYLQLKFQVEQKFAKKINLYDSIERECISLKDNIENFEKKTTFFCDQIEKEKGYMDKIESELKEINSKINATKLDDEKIRCEISKLELELQELIKYEENLTIDIQKLNDLIGDSKYFIEQDKKSERKAKILSKLKAHFTGVQDRLVNLCNVEQRYQVAITKIMGNNMNNIVVDTTQTARECIKFLKQCYAGEQYSAVETFIPLDYIKTKHFYSQIPNINDKTNAIPALNVLFTELNDIRCVLRDIVGNIVICNTDDEASKLSKELHINCVSLNGTYYKKDGIFSGGLASLLQKSKQWDNKAREDMKEEKRLKVTSLSELKIKIRKMQEQKRELEHKLSGLSHRLDKYLYLLLKDQEIKLINKKEEVLKLNTAYTNHKNDHAIVELRRNYSIKKSELEKLENLKNNIEDEIFSNFCESFNINNIRQYEQGDYKKHKERTDRIKQYDDHLDKILNQIQYEQNRDTKTSIENLESKLIELQEAKFNLDQNNVKLKQLINDQKLNKTKENELKQLKQRIEETEKNLKMKEFESNSMKKDLKDFRSSITSIDAKLKSLKNEKHVLLQNCKLNSISVPLCNGTIDKIVLKLRVNDTESEISETDQSSTTDFQIEEKDVEFDYSLLTDSVRKFESSDLNAYIKTLMEKQSSLKQELQQYHRNFKAKETLIKLNEKIQILKKNYNEKLKKLGTVKKNFDEVKSLRCQKFNEFFHSVSEIIDEMFKKLYSEPGAQAFITLQNSEEPYLGGIDFSCIIPQKKFVPMENLSGGEKAMCSMALILSIFNIKPAPFLLFDEIDAALDNSNIKRIKHFFLELKPITQIINISHHELLSISADAAIGIGYSPRLDSSYVVSVELSKYQLQTLAKYCLKNTWQEKLLLLKRKKEKQLKNK